MKDKLYCVCGKCKEYSYFEEDPQHEDSMHMLDILGCDVSIRCAECSSFVNIIKADEFNADHYNSLGYTEVSDEC